MPHTVVGASERFAQKDKMLTLLELCILVGK